MTETGDHGGDTEEETSAALFLYSSEPVFTDSHTPIHELPEIDSDNSISQKNIVPSLSLLLGLPIPYSNLGRIIPNLFSTLPKTNNNSLVHLSRAYVANCLQVWRYLKHYSNLSNDLPYEELHALQIIMSNISSLIRGSSISDTVSRESILQLIRLSGVFLQKSEELCRSIWARFQVSNIILGLSVLIFTTILQVLICYSLIQQHIASTNYYTVNLRHFLLAFIITVLLCITLMSLYKEYKAWMEYFIIIVSLSLTVYLISTQRKEILYCFNTVNTTSILLMAISVISSLTLFSNSYIIWEDKRVEFILQTFNMIFIYLALADYYKENPRIIHFYSICTIIIKIVLLTALVVLVRPFHSCRPEQDYCQNSYLSLPISTLLEKSFLGGFIRLILSAISITLPLFIEISESKLLKRSRWSFVVYFIPLFVYMYWVTKLYPNPPLTSTLLYFYHVTAPRMLYICSIMIAVYCIYSLCVRRGTAEKDTSIQYYNLISVIIWYTGCLLLGDGAVPAFFMLYFYFWILSSTRLMELGAFSH